MQRTIKNITLSFLLSVFLRGQAQETLTIQPDATAGYDATLLNRTDLINGNYGNDVNMYIGGWSGNSQGSPDHDGRSLIRFTQLDDLKSQQVQVTSAKLVLYSSSVRWFNETGDNAGKLFLLNQDWKENTVTWNTQPTYDATSYVATPKLDKFDSVVIDVSTLVQKIVQGTVSNYGFLYKLNNEDPYRSIEFTSSDYTANPLRRPKLIVDYKKIVTNVAEIYAPVTTSQIYPNPVEGDLFVSHSENVVSYEMISTDGAVVIKGEAIKAQEDVSDLPKGLYVIRLKTNNGTLSYKFVKL